LNRAKAIVELLKWINSEAQDYNEELLYAKIPDAVKKINEENINSITFSGKAVE